MKNDKKTKKKELTLKVIEAFQQDVEFDRVRIDLQTRTELNVSMGDTVELEGKKKTLAVVWRGHPSDEGKKLIRIGSITRKKADVHKGEKVKIRQTDKRLDAFTQMKKHMSASHDDTGKVVATVDGKTKKELNKAVEYYNNTRKQINDILATMSRLEQEVKNCHRDIWSELKKEYNLDKDKNHNYSAETGEITEYREDC